MAPALLPSRLTVSLRLCVTQVRLGPKCHRVYFPWAAGRPRSPQTLRRPGADVDNGVTCVQDVDRTRTVSLGSHADGNPKCFHRSV